MAELAVTGNREYGSPGKSRAVEGSSSHFHLVDYHKRKVVTAPNQTLGHMGFAAWASDPDPSRTHTGKRVFPQASTSGARILREPVIVTTSTAYLNRRQMTDAEDASLVYRKHLGDAPLPNLDPRVERKRFLPEPQGGMPRVHGVRKPETVPGQNGGEMESPNLPHLRRVHGKWITYSNHKEESLEDTLCHRRHVKPQDYYGRGYAGDRSGLRGPPKRVEVEENLFKADVENPTFTRFVQSLKPTAGQTCTVRREIQMQRRTQEEHASIRNEVVGLDSWGPGVVVGDD